MDEETKTTFKWKFYRLAVQLNAIILLAAIAVAGFILVPEPYRIPLTVVSLLIAFLLLANFVKKYGETKAWLGAHSEEKKKTGGSQE